jgi:hypothetical protein
MPPGGLPYNLDSVWDRIAVEFEQAKLVQLDRVRIGKKELKPWSVLKQLNAAGRTILRALIKSNYKKTRVRTPASDHVPLED